MKLTIGQGIFLGYGLAMLLMAGAGIAVYQSIGRVLDGNNWVQHTSLVIAEAENIRAGLLEIESSTRAYVATGDHRFLESAEAPRPRIAESRKSMRMMTTDNASQQRRLDVMEPAIDRSLADWSDLLNVRKEKGYSAALAVMQQAVGRERIDEVWNLLAAAEREEHGLLSDRERIAQADVQNADRVVLLGTLVVVAWVVLAGIATRLSITRPLAEFQQIVTSVGEGDLTHKSAREGRDEVGRLGHGLNRMVARLRDMATQTRAATANLDAATMEILASSREQSAVTSEQVAAHQESNVTIQQVSQSGMQMSERANQVTITAEAISIANISGLDAVQKANQTVEAIHEQAEAVAQNIARLSEKTQAAGDILATVNDIAEQSHLLALNAAIEAAAAGEHGRSFAVVAGEIKNLADQSKAATVQVKTILGDIQKEISTSVMLTEEAVKRVDLGKHQADVAASAIRNMAANIDQSVQAFQQIVAGTNQQQIGFENVRLALKDMSRASEQAAASTRQTEKSAASLSDIGAQLRVATERYRL